MPALHWVTGAILGSRRSNRWGPVWEGSEQRGVTQRSRRCEERAGVPRGISGNSPHRDTGWGLRGGLLDRAPLREGLKEKQEPAQRRGNASQALGTESTVELGAGRMEAHGQARGGRGPARAAGPDPRLSGGTGLRPATWSSKHVVGRNEAARMLGPRAGCGRKGSRGAAPEGQ